MSAPSLDEGTLQRLDFPVILERLADLCSFAPSRERALALRPSAVRATVERRLAEVDEAWRLLAVEPGAGRGLRDVRPLVARAARGGRLTGPELVDVACFVEAAAALARPARDEQRYPRLAQIARPIRWLPGIVEAVRAALRDDGVLRDEASPELAALRARARVLEQRVRERMEALMRALERQGVLQEALITQREGRFVLPVRADQRAQVPGIVHDQSASGATVFIEPAPVVELNNELRRCLLDARREEERILDELSGKVGGHARDLEAMIDACAYLDFCLARARLAAGMDAAAPQVVEEPVVRLEQARHPLLGPQAVPIDVELGFDFDVLVITGPNTGGKTVALKTVGLMAVMAQAGLWVPCRSAVLGVFRRIFADIGDEQSIQQNLSTFSAHMTRIVKAVPPADRRSLILLDEIGAGTDPEEGAALAMALLDHLRERGARVVATTHFGRLKAYAYRHARVENASVAFDPETLQPTYRLVVGAPGRSNALEIARRLGLPQDLVERARSYLSRPAAEVEEAISGLDETRRRLEAERAALAQERRRLAEAEQALAARERDLEERRRRFSDQLRAEARAAVNRLIQEAEEAAAQLRRAVQEGRLDQDPAAVLQRLRGVGRRVDALLEGLEEGERPGRTGAAAPAPPGWRPRPGQRVLIVPLQQVGEVVEQAGPDAYLVDTGRMRIHASARDLRPAPAGEKNAGDGAGDPGTRTHAAPGAPDAASSSGARPTAVALRKTGQVPAEISLRGMRVDEALQVLDKYLDDAVLAGLDRVRVIHGKGTGTLRAAVHEALRKDPRVESYALAGPGEGSFGVTVVRLKG